MRSRFILSQTWTNFKRNGAMIISVMLVTFISFLFIGSAALMQTQVQKAKGDWYDQVEVVVWLCPDGKSTSANCASGTALTDGEVSDIEAKIQTELSGVVSSIRYVSKEDFFKNTFVKQYPDGVYEGRTLTAADMQASLRLKLKDANKYQLVSEMLSGTKGVEQVEDQREIFDPVFAVLNRGTVVASVLAGVMIIVAVLLTGTTIRMSAASRRKETEIMRYVGASNWAIRMPFILEGVLASVLGSLLAIGSLMAVVKIFVTDWLAQQITWMTFINMTSVLWIAPWILLGSIVLSVIASSISLRKYLHA
ncbi:permease-like cell division protein FtsX [Alloscardovia omnicolens]|jgi:cell division protein ftsX|nr:permease-like cell division protein FtsX [Alloscardovia omnicolens]MDK6249385.1 permease-like cell division protein FtsX [Alloscardovia omnicolens]MDK6444860.1 permease-like cell division protein FtsX [Alloscardovia omnicolens]MDK6522039.1 permease-like cell division protein FtsX [Alloscardovia omnicolens]MDK6642984.1 permease-like cell division protein FtsX [Alloscardovia omnicolens]MDK8073167.1 permease-like cell division protein FtsX [Alloscardovia omnicolens]